MSCTHNSPRVVGLWRKGSCAIPSSESSLFLRLLLFQCRGDSVKDVRDCFQSGGILCSWRYLERYQKCHRLGESCLGRKQSQKYENWAQKRVVMSAAGLKSQWEAIRLPCGTPLRVDWDNQSQPQNTRLTSDYWTNSQAAEEWKQSRVPLGGD